MKKFIRSFHRWTSVVFVLTVIANLVANGMSESEGPPPLVTYSPLPPLLLLMFTGLYLFVLPWLAKPEPSAGS